jgi:predicted nuclease of predicted toxin-antitoxin system
MPAFLVDENLPHQLVQRAHENGHEARWVRDIMPGAGDREILRELLREGRVAIIKEHDRVGSTADWGRVKQGHTLRADRRRPLHDHCPPIAVLF